MDDKIGFLRLGHNYAQALCLISHVLLINLQLWAHNKWLKHIFALQNVCDREDQYILIKQSAVITALLEYIDLFL